MKKKEKQMYDLPARNYDHHRYERQIETALTLWRDELVEVTGGPLVPALPGNVIPIGRKAGMAE